MADGTIPPTAPNHGATLEALAEEIGEPTPRAASMAFRGADEVWMLERGQETSTEVILLAGAAFVRSAVAIWTKLTDAQRATLHGYDPELDAVIVRELVELRRRNVAYDRLAQGTGASVAERRQRARDQFSSGVRLRQNIFQTLRDMFGGEHPVVVGLANTMKRAESADIVANSLVTLADTLRRLRHGADGLRPDARIVDELDLARLTDATERTLREAAALVRDTAELAEARPQDLAAAQRTLDVQDGRVLHVIGLVTRAFRRARRSDGSILVPELGDLARIFGAGGRSRDDEPDPTPAPTPPAPPIA